jgi:hypothetical protein
MDEIFLLQFLKRIPTIPLQFTIFPSPPSNSCQRQFGPKCPPTFGCCTSGHGLVGNGADFLENIFACIKGGDF